MKRYPKGSMVLGSLALAGAGGLLAVTVLRAVIVDPVGEPAATEVEPGVADVADVTPEGDVTEGARKAAPAARSAVGEEGARSRVVAALRDEEEAPAGPWDDPITLAVDNDPFNPARRPPARRYQLPSERVERVREEPRERPEAPDFRVVGAATLAGSGLALVQIDRDEPRLLVMGESLQGYTLAAVDGESATLEGPAGSLRFTVMEPLQPRRRDDDRRRRGDDDDDDERRGREEEQQQLRLEQLQNVMQRFQGTVRALPGQMRQIVIPPGGLGGRGGRGGGGTPPAPNTP